MCVFFHLALIYDTDSLIAFREYFYYPFVWFINYKPFDNAMSSKREKNDKISTEKYLQQRRFIVYISSSGHESFILIEHAHGI